MRHMWLSCMVRTTPSLSVHAGTARVLHTFQCLPNLPLLLVGDPLLTLETAFCSKRYMAIKHQESTISRWYMTARSPLQLHHICRATRIMGPAAKPRYTHLFLYRYSLRNRALRLSMAAGYRMQAPCYLSHIRGAAGASSWRLGGLIGTMSCRTKMLAETRGHDLQLQIATPL